MHLAKILDIFESMIKFLSPCLNKCVMLAFVNMDGKLDFSIES